MNSVEILANAAERDKLNHAYLAPVYPGTDLRHYGAELAREILCDPTEDGCRDKVMRNAHPDHSWFTVLNDNNKISIDQVRDIISHSAHAPMKTDRKVYVISRAEDLSNNASHTVLKVLEEPPEFLYFILLTEDPNRLLPTILSRCQVLPTGGMTEQGLASLLASRGFSWEEVDYLISAANHRADLADEVLEDEIDDPLATVEGLREKYRDLNAAELAKEYAGADNLVEKDVTSNLFYNSLESADRSMIVESAKSLKDLNEPEVEYLLTAGLYFWQERGRRSIETEGAGPGDEAYQEFLRKGRAIDRALKELETNANVQLLLEATFLKLGLPGSSLVDAEGN